MHPSDLYAIADAYEVPWEALVLTLSGQLSLPLAAASLVYRDRRVQERTEDLGFRLTPDEKRQLTSYLGYLRFIADREGLLATTER